jgi:DNA segregation ATPase FtsK/SpoIIIE-like protein
LFLTSFNTPSVAEYDEEASDAHLSGEADDALIEAAEPWRILKVGLLVKEVGRPDRLFENAVRLVVEKDRCNTALLQRGLSIDYVRACLLTSQLSQTGFIKESSTRKNTYDLLFSKADMEARLSDLNKRVV